MNPHYWAAAQDCISLAKRSGDVSEKLVLLGLAQAWVKLSGQAELIDGFEATPDQGTGSIQ
jgi:hypothetical protein